MMGSMAGYSNNYQMGGDMNGVFLNNNLSGSVNTRQFNSSNNNATMGTGGGGVSGGMGGGMSGGSYNLGQQ